MSITQYRVTVMCQDGSRVEGMWEPEDMIDTVLLSQLNDLMSTPTLCVQNSETRATYIPNHVLIRSMVVLQKRIVDEVQHAPSNFSSVIIVILVLYLALVVARSLNR